MGVHATSKIYVAGYSHSYVPIATRLLAVFLALPSLSIEAKTYHLFIRSHSRDIYLRTSPMRSCHAPNIFPVQKHVPYFRRCIRFVDVTDVLPLGSDLLTVCAPSYMYLIAKSTTARHVCGDCYCCCLVEVL